MNLMALEKSRIETEEKINALVKQYHTDRQALDDSLKELNRQIGVSRESLDLDKVLLAETILDKDGKYALGGEERWSVIKDAIKAFAVHRAENLRQGYFGTKNYDRWRGQRSDHPYYMGPRHGSICFAIGLKSEFRKADLTDKQIEACLYYIRNIERIESAEVALAKAG